MKAKQLIILLIVAVVLGGLAFLTQRPDETPSDVIGRRVLGELPLNDIAAIAITTPGEATRLSRPTGVWVSEQDFNYPADFGRIKSAILKLSELKVGQVVEAEGADKAAMKMVAPADSPDGGTLVELLDAAGETLGALLVGDTRKRSDPDQGRFGGYPDGQFVSPDGGATVYLVKDNLYEFSRSTDWLNKDLVNVPGTDVTTVRITGPDRDTLELTVPEGKSTLELPELDDKEEMNTSQANGIKSALSYLRFESVADPALADDVTGLDRPETFEATTRAGEIYTVQIGAQVPDSENRYARLRVELKPAAPRTDTRTDAEQTEADKQAAEEEKAREATERAELEQKVADLNTRLEPWTYVIASYKIDTMRSTRDKIVQAIEETSDDDKKEE